MGAFPVGAMNERNALVSRLVPFLLMRRYEPGERVPSERELAERFGVSRGQIREALSFLEALRFIERRAKSGVYMANEEGSVETLAQFAQLGIPLDGEDVRQSVEMRKIHEIAAIRLAGERRSDENITRMREILDEEGRKAAIGDNIAEDDRRFHCEIVRATQNTVFLKVVNVFYIMTRMRRVVYFEKADRCRTSHAEHLRMFDAIVARDAALATALMEAHLKGVDSYWHGLIDQAGPQRARAAAR
jgi:DNA-binding FadR family transcriptional regulator